MTLRGMAFLPIWHDVDEPMEAEFNRWHTVEHMPERLATPGIVVGRRYHDLSAPLHRYFTLYEAQSFDVFESDGYFMTANARSIWTQRVHPAFQNFVRAPCHLGITRGRGVGGVLATLRIQFPLPMLGQSVSPRDAFSLMVRETVEHASALDGVTGAHAGLSAKVSRAPLSQESLSLRPNASSFDAVILLEAINQETLKEAVRITTERLRAVPEAVHRWEVGCYDLSYLLYA